MHLLLVDGSGYHFPRLSRPAAAHAQVRRAAESAACIGFCNMLYKLTEDLEGDDRPTHMAVIFDYSGKTFRDELYADYKAHRPPPPDELIPQFPLTRAATRAYSHPLDRDGGLGGRRHHRDLRHARRCAEGGKVTIVSSDKDLMQLVDARRLASACSTPSRAPASRRCAGSARTRCSTNSASRPTR